ADKVRKEPNHAHRYYENHAHEPQQQPSFANNSSAPNRGEETISRAQERPNGEEEELGGVRRAEEFDEAVPQPVADPGPRDEGERFSNGSDLIRVTDDQ